MSAKAKSSSQLHLQGTVLGFNLDSKGHIEGALVETSRGPEQVNFPKRVAKALARSVHVGSKIDFSVELERKVKNHRVYRVCDKKSRASGQVIRLNYNHHGKLNGCHLDDATFLHIKRHGAKEYDIRLGETVKARGVRRAGHDAVVLEVRTIKTSRRTGKAAR